MLCTLVYTSLPSSYDGAAVIEVPNRYRLITSPAEHSENRDNVHCANNQKQSAGRFVTHALTEPSTQSKRDNSMARQTTLAHQKLLPIARLTIYAATFAPGLA